VLSANCGSHQKWWRNIRARIPRRLRDNFRSAHFPIETESALLEIDAEHFDRIFKRDVLVRQPNLRFLRQHGIETMEAGRAALVDRGAEDDARFARRGLSEKRWSESEQAEKCQRKCPQEKPD
jgi:hypothetical protein